MQKLENEVAWSEWATPVVAVPKANGLIRLCGDFKVTINSELKVDQYSLPRIEYIFANLAAAEKFTKIDLRQAYLQLEMEEESKKYLTINTHKGLYQYNRLLFGVTSAPAIWQRTVDQILQNIPRTQVIMDDLIITGESDQEHLKNLHQVLERLHDYNVRAEITKCEFFKESITYSGHRIDKHGHHKMPDKIDAVVNAHRSTNVTLLRAYLGLLNLFLPNLSSVMWPLNQMLEKGRKRPWTEKCEKAFLETKLMISSDQVLTHYDPQLPIKLECDASAYGIGAVLSHVMEDGIDRPIGFLSRLLTSAKRSYAQIDKEALALILGCEEISLVPIWAPLHISDGPSAFAVLSSSKQGSVNNDIC